MLQRYTIRLDHREEKLGFLIQSVPEGGDIYELARRHKETEARKKALREAAEAEAKQRQTHQEEGAALAVPKVGGDVKNGLQKAASQAQTPSTSAAECESAGPITSMAQRSPQISTSDTKTVHATKTAEEEAADMEREAADMAEAATIAAVRDAIRLTKAAKVQGEDAQCLAALLSKNDAERAILMEDTGAADVVVDEDVVVLDGESLAVAAATTATTDAAPTPTAKASGQKSGEDTAEVALVDADETDKTVKTKASSPLNKDGDCVVVKDAPEALVPNQRSSRRVAAAAAAAVAVPAPAAASSRAKKNVVKRLTIMPGSPVLIVADNIRKWRKWCEDEYAKRGSSDDVPVEDADAEDKSVARQTANAAGDANDKKDTPFTTLPPPSVFGTLDSTVAAALEAGIFNDTEMFKQRFNRTSLRCALVGAIREGDYIESVRVQSPAKSYAYQINGLRRYISTSSKEQIQLFGDCIKHDHHYPIYVTYCRKVVIQLPPPMDLTGGTTGGSGSKRSHPVESFDSGPAKRRRKAEVIDVSGASAKAAPPPLPPPKPDEVIDLLDSSDEGEDETNEEEKKECMEIEEVQDAQVAKDRPSKVGYDVDEVVALTDDSASPPTPPARLIGPLPVALPDPAPAFHVGDFVLTKYGPGKVVSSRVDRFPENEQLLVAPILMYAIAFRYGFAHIPSTEISVIEGSEYTEKRILTYRNITLNKMDLLRLWYVDFSWYFYSVSIDIMALYVVLIESNPLPHISIDLDLFRQIHYFTPFRTTNRPLTYLNDSLINFYIKYMIMEKLSATGSTLSVGDFHVFPTYFYSRISHLQNGGTAYKDTKAARKKLYHDVKGWTKGVDIFKKRFLIFPINYDLHWTFVLAANPGDVLKVIPLPPVPRKKKASDAAPVPASAGTDVEAIGREATGAVGAGGDVGTVSRVASAGGEERTPGQQLPSSDADKEGAAVAEVPGSEAKMEIDAAEEDSEIRPLNEQCPETDGSCTQEATSVPADIGCISTTTVPAASKESDTSLAPCLIHFDSGRHFKLHRSGTIFKHIRKYLAACYEATKTEEFPQCNITAKTLPGISPPIPQQDNAKDCGVYTLEFIERVLANPPNIDAEFIERKGVVKDGPFGIKWFDQKSISQKRLDLTKLIRELEIREYFFEEI